MRLKKKHFGFWIKLLVVAGVAVSALFFYFSPWGQNVRQWGQDGWHYVSARAQWECSSDSVWVVGHKRTSQKAILNALKIVPHQSMNDIDLDQKRLALEKLPWVKMAVIERKLPNRLKITIEEKTPIARWQNQGEYCLLDEFGKPIKDKQYLSEDLILVVGADAPEHVLELLAALDKFPDIGMRVRSAKRIEGRRWSLRLMDAEKGLEILLPQTNIVAALARLDQKKQLLKKDLESIDMRLADRIVVRYKKAKGKKGKK